MCCYRGIQSILLHFYGPKGSSTSEIITSGENAHLSWNFEVERDAGDREVCDSTNSYDLDL